jgi:hypothetical protein
MRKQIVLRSAFVLLAALAVGGCSDSRVFHPGGDHSGDPQGAVVFNQNSNNISSVDFNTGAVTHDVGGLVIGPTANRAEIRGNRAYVVNSGAFPGSTGANIQVIDLATDTVENTIPFADGQNPWDIAFVTDTKAYVTTLYGNNVTVIDPTRSGAEAITGTIPLPVFDGSEGDVPAGPESILVLGGYAYTTNTGFDDVTFGYMPGSVSVIDTATDTVVDRIDTTQVNPQDLDADASGMIHVICTGNYADLAGVLDVIDPDTRSVIASVDLGGSPGNVSIAGNYALIGAGDGDSCDLYMVTTDAHTAVHDSGTPWNLMDSSGWCTVGKIAQGQGPGGLKAFVPAGVWGAEARLFELQLTPGVPALTQTYSLDPAADLPAAVGLLY